MRHAEPEPNRTIGSFSTRSVFLTAFAVGAAAILGGSWFYLSEHQRLQQRAEAQLSAVAQLKVDQIANWRAERLGDAGVIADTPFYRESVERYLASPNEALAGQILARFQALHHHYHYFDILLVDAAGTVRLSFLGGVNPVHHSEAGEVEEAFHARRPVLSDIHGEAAKGALSPHIDTVAPFFTPGGEPAGAIILQSNARDFLYPLIQSRPTPSPTAETILVRRDGDSVLYLNDLRWQDDTALTLRIPLTRVDLPAVMAVMGKQGVIAGRDYRGVEVLAALEPVPETPWFMVAKVDAEEVFAEWRQHATLILALISLITAGAAAAAWVGWRRSRERERFTGEMQKLANIVENAHWGVVVAGPDGSTLEMVNTAYARMHGYTSEEILRIPLAELYPPQWREELRGVSQKIREQGHLTFETEHVRKDGSTFPIQLSVTAIRDKQGAIRFFAGNAEDITERKRAEEALRRTQFVVDTTSDGVYWVGPDARILSVNDAVCKSLGYTRDELLSMTVNDISPDFPPAAWKRHWNEVRERRSFTIETRGKTRDGRLFPVEVMINYVQFENREYNCAFVRDISERKRMEEDRLLLASITQSMDDAVVSTTRTGLINTWNRGAERVFGHSQGEAVGKPLSILIPPGRMEEARDTLARLWRGEHVPTFETERLRKDGSLVPVSLTVSPVKNAAGSVVSVCAVVRDITARKKAEEELRLRSQIMENMAEGVFLIRASDAAIVYTNPRFDEMFGYGPGELIGKNVSVVNAPSAKTPEETAEEINSALRRDGVWSGEVLNIKNNGEPFWCAVRVSTFHSLQFGEVWVAVHADITSRKWAEEALAESERNYRTIADFTNDWETWLTPNGWLRYVSPSCERITGYPPEKFIADPEFMMSIIHRDDRELYQRHLNDCHNAHTCCHGPDCGPEHLKFRIVRKDGAERWIEHICQSAFDGEGTWLGRRASNRDITERVEAQEAMRQARLQAEAATKLKDKFVSLVAHDLRSPLSSLTGLLKVAQNDAAVRGSARLSEILGMVTQSGESMLTFIDDLLNISRLQTGSITCRPMTFNARGLAMESLNILSHLAESKGLTLRNEVPDGISIHADLTLIAEALRNLISNAIKFTPEGGVVTVGAEESNAHVTLAVSDTGVGVPPSMAADLFLHEVRTTTPGTLGERGTGLGLPYSRDIVAAHGGELSFESEPGKGSVFKITLPRAR